MQESERSLENTHEMPVRLLSDQNLARLNRAVISGRIIPLLVAVMFTVGAAGTTAHHAVGR